MEVTIQHNNHHKLNILIHLLTSSLNLVALGRLNPIFKSHESDLTNAGVTVKYPNSRLEQMLRKAISISDLHISDPSVIQMLFGDIGKRGFKDTHLWIVVENIAVRYFYEIKDNINKPYARYFLFKEAPLYIQALARPAIKLYKKSVVTISDDLPLSISMTVNSHLENQREDVLISIADFLNPQELIELNDIMRDRSISLREGLDNILKRTGGKAQSDFSYCLTCGTEIESGKKFCDATKHNYENKNNCLNRFNYWLKVRLGIKDEIDRRNKRNEFCKEMVELTKEFPLTAWDEFKRRHPKLYEKRYKERWERERRLKQ